MDKKHSIEDKAFDLVDTFKSSRSNSEDRNEIIQHKEMLPENAHDTLHLLHQVESIKRACNEAIKDIKDELLQRHSCLLYTSPSPRDS